MSKINLLIIFVISIFIYSFPFNIFAQPIQRLEITSSPNPVGSGARALGMGGAFIALADDATAASWNPGGLFQLQLPEISFVGTIFRRNEDNLFGNNPEASRSQHVTETSLNYLSLAFPFALWRRHMIISINYQELYDFSREWKFPLTLNVEGLSVTQNIDYHQDGETVR